MKKVNRFFKFNLILILIAVLFFTAVIPVQAATVGQQITVSACSAVRVVIKGTNQYGTRVTYTLNKTATNCGSINIPGRWWTGTISVYAYYNVTAEYPYYKGQSLSKTIPMGTSTAYYPVAFPTPSARKWVLWRAQTWVNDNVAYDQRSTHDGYRQDCSGFVSFAWQLLPKPGTSPAGMSAYSYQIPFDSLKPGDALNNPSAHVMLFVQWVDQSKGIFIAQQEEYPGSGTRQRTFNLNKTTGVITQGIYYTYPGTYKAIRKYGL